MLQNLIFYDLDPYTKLGFRKYFRALEQVSDPQVFSDP